MIAIHSCLEEFLGNGYSELGVAPSAERSALEQMSEWLRPSTEA
jgi:hypothetical protein